MKTISLFITLSLLLISPALAGLQGSAHDFQAVFGTTDGPCGYCHSVHNSVGGTGSSAMLADMATVTEVYDPSAHPMLAGLTTSTANRSDAPLCLTCHDGTYASLSTNAELKTIGQNKIINTKKDIGSINGAPGPSGSSLKDDHPVGFVFDASDPEDKIKAPPADSNVHVTFGEAKNEMWCSSCHNVHNNDNPPFLTMSNAGSALCLECHLK